MTKDEVDEKLRASHTLPETPAPNADEAYERECVVELGEWCQKRGVYLNVEIAKCIVNTPNGMSETLWKPMLELKKRKPVSKIILPDMDQATKKVAMELLSGGKK